MRNPSKNTIKRLMRQTKDLIAKNMIHPPTNHWDQYHLFCDVGESLFKMSKGKISSGNLTGIEKYIK